MKHEAKTMPAIPKTMRPPIDFNVIETNIMRSGLPIWKGDLHNAILLDKLNGAISFSEFDINSWWVHFGDGKKSIVVYCKEDELISLGLEKK